MGTVPAWGLSRLEIVNNGDKGQSLSSGWGTVPSGTVPKVLDNRNGD